MTRQTSVSGSDDGCTRVVHKTGSTKLNSGKGISKFGVEESGVLALATCAPLALENRRLQIPPLPILPADVLIRRGEIDAAELFGIPDEAFADAHGDVA